MISAATTMTAAAATSAATGFMRRLGSRFLSLALVGQGSDERG